MTFTDDDLKRLRAVDEANRKRIDAMGGEGSIVLTRHQLDGLIARLEAAELACNTAYYVRPAWISEGWGSLLNATLIVWRKAAGK